MLPFIIKIFVLSIFEWPFYTGFTIIIILFWSLLKELSVLLKLKHLYKDVNKAQCTEPISSKRFA